MTTAHAMLCARAAVTATLAALSFAAVQGCAAEAKLEPPGALVSPYPAASQVVWAVAPLANESGSALVDELAITDALVEQVRQTQGVTALATNRTLAGMRALGLGAIRTPADASSLARALGADGVLVGTITAWDPYEPPTLGLDLALFARTGAMLAVDIAETDPLTLRGAATDDAVLGDAYRSRPVAVVSDHADASNHEVLAQARAYAEGRRDPNDPLGWRRYTKSMARFTEFVCYRVLERLLRSERQRVVGAQTIEANAS